MVHKTNKSEDREEKMKIMSETYGTISKWKIQFYIILYYISGVDIVYRHKICYEIMSDNFLEIDGAQQFSSSINTKRTTLR